MAEGMGPRTTVRWLAARGLPGAPSAAPPGVPPSAPSWRALRTFIAHHRLTGLATAAVAAGELTLTPAQADELAADHVAATAVAAHLERVLVEVSDLLSAGGIAHRVLKGPALARLDYPAAQLRSFGDIDLLVAADDLDAAVRVLGRLGGRRRFPEPRPGFDRRFGKGTCVVLPDGTEVDLHRTLASGPYGMTIDLRDLWSSTSVVDLHGRRLEALDATARLLHACVHASLGNHPPRLLALRDVAQVWLANTPDLSDLLARARRWGVTAPVARAVSAAWETLRLSGGGALPAWAATYRPNARDEALLAVYERTGPRYAAQAVATLRVLPGVRSRAAYVRALAAPSRAYLAGRHRNRAQRLAGGLRSIRRSR